MSEMYDAENIKRKLIRSRVFSVYVRDILARLFSLRDEVQL